ncbi:MAG: hypothetical protein IRY91_03505 [Gemmatimonadaceae bacterium]|nr:hypothetical protein [Gemmatimonadaceae bacterium]
METQRYGTIIVVGGGCYGSYYVRQLGRAAAAGAIACKRLVVVDRDPECRVGRSLSGAPGGDPVSDALRPELVVQEWAPFFATYLDEAATRAEGEGAPGDAIVPSPLMPHLMYEWLLARARTRWPGRLVETRPLANEPSVPWQRAAPDGTHYVSFAEWMCPINCVEPPTCPVIRGPRTWSLPPAVRAYVAAERGRGRNLVGPVIFHCRHRAYGVGMFDTSEVLAADRLVAAAGARGPAEVLVGTVSHCHGALDMLGVGP